MRLHIFHLVEGPEESEFGGSVLFRVAKGTAMGLPPLGYRLCRKENTYRIGQLAIGSNVEDEFCCGRFRIVAEGSTLTDEIVLIDVPLSASISLEAADRHADIMNGRRAFVVGRWSMVGLSVGLSFLPETADSLIA
jgi:hypothetical protein